jgi:hypothetical protein
MLKPARPPGSLYALVVAIEATAMLDPYPRLTQVMQRETTSMPDPYPRLAQVMQHLAAQHTGMRTTGTLPG